MKKALAIVGMAAFGIVGTACNADAPVDKGSVSITTKYAVANGDSLRVNWIKVDGTDAYVVYDNSSGTLSPIDTLMGDTILSYTFGTPCTQVGVSTMVGEELGDPTTIDLLLTTRDSVFLYSRLDPDHNGYFRITLDSAQVILYDSTNRDKSYGYVDGPEDTLSFNTSYPLYTDEAGIWVLQDTTVSSLDDMTLAPDPDTSVWVRQDAAVQPGFYWFWVDECLLGSPGWSGLDMFGKVQVLDVNRYAITMKIQFQTGIFGLRWLVDN